ncbi:MAG: hydrogenase [Saccharofermentanales bacterium]
MENYLDILTLLILLTSFLLMASKRTSSYIRVFRGQSLLIATAAAVTGIESFIGGGHFDILVVCAIIIILKVIVIPNLLYKTYANIESKVEKDFYWNIPLLLIISCIIVVITYISISDIDGIKTGQANIQAVNSISLVLIGMFFMISRKKAIGQIVGFLAIENGLFITAIVFTKGMPFIVDMGIFIDLITAVLVMGVMVFKINEKFDSTDTSKLKNLRG